MSDAPEWPSETMNDTESLRLRPLSNADDLSLPATGIDLSRAHSHPGISIANGPNGPEDEEDEEEAVEGEYVAVDHEEANDFSYWFRRPPVHERTRLDDLHPFVQVLTASNVDDCVAVEAAFPEQERCTREKFIYRLTKCPELSLGMFTMPMLEEGKPKPRPTLIGHVVATRSSAPKVVDESMEMPENWQSKRVFLEGDKAIGHEDLGGTVCVHSLAVAPEHQGKGVGRTLMKSYIQRIKDAEAAERIAIIAHDNLIPFYESLGFENKGQSDCKFGGGGWYDLVIEFPKQQT